MEFSSIHAQEVGTDCNELVAVKTSLQSYVVEVFLSFARGLPYFERHKTDCDRVCSYQFNVFLECLLTSVYGDGCAFSINESYLDRLEKDLRASLNTRAAKAVDT